MDKMLLTKVLAFLLLGAVQAMSSTTAAAASTIDIDGNEKLNQIFSDRQLNTNVATPDPIVVPLKPFEVIMAGKAVQSEDVDKIMEDYLFEQLSVSFPPLVAVLLAHDDSVPENRRRRQTRQRQLTLEHPTYFSAGAGIFLDPELVPLEEDFQAAQQAALDDLLSLQRFVNLRSYFWVVEPVQIGEKEPEEEQDPEIVALERGPIAAQDPKNKAPSIVMLVIGGCLLIFGVCLARRKVSSMVQEKQQLERLQSRVVQPNALKIDMCGNIGKRVPSTGSSDRPPRRAHSQVSSEGMEITEEGEVLEMLSR